MKEINYFALSHLMGKEPGTENQVYSKLANPRLLEGQVKISPWHHPVTHMSYGHDLQSLRIELLPQPRAICGAWGVERKKKSLCARAIPFRHTESFPSI